MTVWRNWIARQTSNLAVAGSNPVTVECIFQTHYYFNVQWVCSSVVEHGIADPMVAGSIPVAPLTYFFYFIINIIIILVSLVGQDIWFSPRRPGFKSGRGIPFFYLYYIYKRSHGAIGSASDSRPEGWGFKSLWLQILFYINKHYCGCGLGLVGYDVCLTHRRCRVQFSETVYILINK